MRIHYVTHSPLMDEAKLETRRDKTTRHSQGCQSDGRGKQLSLQLEVCKASVEEKVSRTREKERLTTIALEGRRKIFIVHCWPWISSGHELSHASRCFSQSLTLAL